MWIAVLTSAISALAALGGVLLNSRLTSKRLTLELDRKAKDSDRTEFFKIASDFVAHSWALRRQALPATRSGGRADLVDDRMVLMGAIDVMASRLRLLARRHRTIIIALELADDLKRIIRILDDAGQAEASRSQKDQLTLLLAAAKLQEESLLAAIREECGIPEPEGTPPFDFDRDLRRFLRGVFRGDEASVERVAQQLKLQPSPEERHWTL